jgi:hypothetical protein
VDTGLGAGLRGNRGRDGLAVPAARGRHGAECLHRRRSRGASAAANPAGRVGEVPAGPTAYALYPREVRGDWMRVEMSEPSDYCADPAPDVPRIEGWVRWRDRGALQLWYFTRGC